MKVCSCTTLLLCCRISLFTWKNGKVFLEPLRTTLGGAEMSKSVEQYDVLGPLLSAMGKGDINCFERLKGN